MEEFKLFVPTYNATLFPDQVASGIVPDFGYPHVPVVIREADGVPELCWALHDYNDLRCPDIQIERRPRGGPFSSIRSVEVTPGGYVYYVDDGRSFLLPENGIGPTPSIQIVNQPDNVPDMDPSPNYSPLSSLHSKALRIMTAVRVHRHRRPNLSFGVSSTVSASATASTSAPSPAVPTSPSPRLQKDHLDPRLFLASSFLQTRAASTHCQ